MSFEVDDICTRTKHKEHIFSSVFPFCLKTSVSNYEFQETQKKKSLGVPTLMVCYVKGQPQEALYPVLKRILHPIRINYLFGLERVTIYSLCPILVVVDTSVVAITNMRQREYFTYFELQSSLGDVGLHS